MAGFSSTSFHHHHPFLLDSVFLPNSPSTTTIHTENNIMPNPISTQILHTYASAINNNNCMDNSSSILTHNYHTSKRKCSSNSAQSKEEREVKGKKQKKIKEDEEKKKNGEEDYIHLRARRGQATDSHSLAERVRRERISERMKLLQDLVPGCDKLHVYLCDKQVSGKALMLDEIINYVHSLQNQVEFLSMKLASVNPMFYDFGLDFESFMVRTDLDLSDLPSPLPSMQNNYSFLDNAVLFQQAQVSNVIPQPQESRQTWREVDDQREKIMNQSGFCPTSIW